MAGLMSKRSVFTVVTPLPADMTREVVLGFLHDHASMIDLNPLVVDRHQIPAPAYALEGERRCAWWSITDVIEYVPGTRLAQGQLTYAAAFNDLPDGIQTHVYAPMGTEIRERWALRGNMPGEPRVPVELGSGAPQEGLYLQEVRLDPSHSPFFLRLEDCELHCNFLMTSFVKKTLKKAHNTVIERICEKAKLVADARSQGIEVRHDHGDEAELDGSNFFANNG
ncbi:hypothetical protein F4780DRAFT_193888 [Xylariomycetidae sp. FL0641]|nr:hypothetical protein F4780DRAFT_193888 [Xylariomycetidae sp. FL0641]